MKGKYLLRGIPSVVLGAILLFAVTASSSTNVSAQGRFHGGFVGGFHGGGFHTRVFVGPGFGYGYGYPYWYGYYPYGYYSRYVFGDSVSANSQGYYDGLKTGEGDSRHHRSYDPERSHYFRNAGFGNFAYAYRAGFDRGYSVGYRG
jgi:hypothetical protein